MNQEAQKEERNNVFLPKLEDGRKPLIGIVGHGYVGKAIDDAINTPYIDKMYVDPKYRVTLDQLVDQDPSITFVCLPTPMSESGKINCSDIINTITTLMTQTRSGVVLKSTVTPDIVDKIVRTLNTPEHAQRFIYSPEFLTEKRATEDMVDPDYMIIGGPQQSIDELMMFFRYNSSIKLPESKTFIVNPVEAAVIKYAINTFLAMKVTFFNQLFDTVEKDLPGWINPNHLLRIISTEPRIGGTHWRVPGTDGKRGFGGACFPKDLAAWLYFTDNMSLLAKVKEINDEYRSQYDLDSREKENNVTFINKDKVGEENEHNGETETELEDIDSRDSVKL